MSVTESEHVTCSAVSRQSEKEIFATQPVACVFLGVPFFETQNIGRRNLSALIFNAEKTGHLLNQVSYAGAPDPAYLKLKLQIDV